MYKNASGRTVSIEQMKSWADSEGVSVEEYASMSGFTLIQEEIEIPSDEGKLKGAATTDADAAPVIIPENVSEVVTVEKEEPVEVKAPKSENLIDMESRLEELLLEQKSARSKPGSSGRVIGRKISTLKSEIQREKEAVFSPNKGPNLEDPFSLVMETEETVESILEKEYPIQIVQTDVRNAVKYKDPRTGENKYINLRPSSYEEKLNTANQINQLKNSFETLTAEEYGSQVVDTFIDRFEQGTEKADIEQLNYGLNGTGYEIKTVAQTEQSVNPLGAPVMSTAFFQVYKDGKLVDTLGKEELADFFNNNLTPEDEDILKNNSFKAYEAFESKISKRKEAEGKKVDELDMTRAYLDSGKFSERLAFTLSDPKLGLGFTNEEAQVVKNYIDNRKDKRKIKYTTYGAATSSYTMSPQDYVQYKTDLSDLPEEIKAKLTPELLESIFSQGYENYKTSELDSRMVTIQEAMMKESGKANLLKLAYRFDKEDVDLYKKGKKEYKEELIKTRDHIAKTIVGEAERISKSTPNVEFKVDNVDGQYVFTATQTKKGLSEKEQKQVNLAMGQWYKLQRSTMLAQADYNQSAQNYVQDIAQFQQKRQDRELTPGELFDLSMKEYDTGALLAKDLNDAFAGLALAVPTVLGGSEYAVKEQERLQRKNQQFETMLTYDQALAQGRAGLFGLRTLGQQAPNIILAIGTSGAGTALGMSKIATQLAVGTQFGVSSGAQKYRDLVMAQKLGEDAKNQKELNRVAYESGLIDYNTYASNELDLNKTIAMGDLTDQQIVNAAWATGFIEGGVTSFIGTAPNSLKAIKDFSKSGVNVSNFLYKSNLRKLGMAGLELGKRLGGEILEEELIYFGDTALSEGLILGRDMDFSQWDDTAVSALITSGTMSTPGVAYSALMNNAATVEFQKDINGLTQDIQDLSISIQESTDASSRDILIAQLATKMKEQGFAVTGLEVDAIALGGDNQKKLLGLGRLEKELMSEAGVRPEDTPTIAEEKVNNYKAKLNKEGKNQQAENFDIRRATIKKQQDQLKKDVNYDRVENSLGPSGKRIKQKLETTDTNKANEYRSLNRKDKLAFIINEIRNEQRLSHVRLAKESPAIVKKVESLVDANGKPLSKTAKEKAYANAGANLMFNKGRAITLSTTAKASSEIVNAADLTILEVSNKKEAQKLLEDTDLDDDAKNEIYASLEKEGSNGFIYNNKYITFNKDRAEAAIKEGNILQSTAIVHEVAHAIDDRVFDTPEKQKQYADNLHARLSQPDLAGVDEQVKNVLANRDDLADDAGKEWKDTSAAYKDEYTKVAQETFYAFDAELNQEAKRSKESFFNGINTATPDGALNYMLNRNADFREGKIGKRIQKKVKKGPKKSSLKGKPSFSAPSSFNTDDKNRMFQKGNEAFNTGAESYGLDLRINEDGKPNFTKEQWDAVPDDTKLVLGYFVGQEYESYVAYRMRSRDQVPRYDEFKDEIINKTATGIQKGDDGIPFLIKSYNPEGGTKLSSYIFGQIDNRLQGVINKTKGFGELTVEAAPSEPGRRELVGKEKADDTLKRAEREAKEVKKEFPQITDEVIVLDKEGNPVSISNQVQKKVKDSVKVAYATTKFTAPIGSKKFRTELANAMRNKLGNLFKSIMDRGANFDNTEKVGNKEKRANYDSFVDRNFQNVYSIMPKSTISDRFPFLMEEITNEDGSPDYMSVAEVEAYNDAIDRGAIRGKRIANKYANNRKFKKRKYDGQVKKEGTEYLKANDKATNVRNARKTSFADVIAEEAAFDILPEVLRENGLAKEAEIVEIEKQTGRGKFSVGRMDPTERFKFDLNKDLFFDRVMSLKNLSKGNIKKVFLTTYGALDFDPKIIDGVAEQFANRLKPVNKAVESVPVPLFKEILIDISNQADEALALQKLVGAAMNASEVFRDKDNIILTRAAAIENMQMIIDKYGVDEGLQMIVAFANSSFSSSASIGLFKFDLKTQKLVPGIRKDGRPITKPGADLFSGAEDLLQSLYNKLNLDGKKIDKITNKKLFFTDGTSVDRKYSPVTNVSKGMLRENYKPDEINYKAAQEFVTSFFENFAKQDLDPNVALTLLSTMNNGTSNALRASARVWGKSTVIKSDNPSDFRFEHAIPARVVLAYMYDYYVNGNTEHNMEALWNDYRVTIIPVKEMDKVLDAAGFGAITTSNYVPGETAWHNRYYNLFTKGRMPYAMVSYDGTETVGEQYEQYFNEKGKNPVIKADATQETEEKRTVDKAMANAREGKYSITPKGISVYDFDDTLAFSKSQVIVTKDGKTYRITPAEFAKQGETLANEGAEFNFSEFSKVVKGTPGPLAPRLKKAIEKFGNKNIFVLTARPADSAPAIYQFLKGIGLEIPLENITGLANGAPAAKAAWMVGKVADGYNDFYFVDDHMGNVKAVKDVLNVFDVKGKVQQARVKHSISLDVDFNKMIERQKGVEDFKEFSSAVARRRGKTKGRFKFFIPPSAEDFRGLTQYVFAGKGKQGEADQAFFEQNLMDPYFQGVAAMERARQTIKNDTRALNKMFKPVRRIINKLVPEGDYTYDSAIRVYLWDKAGYEIPGISKRDQARLVKLVRNDADLSGYADGLLAVSKKDKWTEPGEFWDAKTVLSDLQSLTEKVNRKEYLAEFIENAETIFSEKNLNKIEAVYGTNLREAIEDSLFAMKNGTNRTSGANKITNAWNNWVNNSVGTIMFFNRRSALLQTISSINFINWSDNNPLKAGLAFANQPQYWKDFAMLFNSDKLKQRRGGLKSDVQEQEIANAAKNAKDKASAAVSYLLKIGFTPTQIADSFAIAAGGATFYRNRVNTYLKEGMSQEDAEAKAFLDFSKISDESQQSGDPALVSQQQRSVAGRLILSFQNTPMQYTRLMKKAAQDLVNGRGDAKSNISKIVYYGAVQNIIFSALQNAAFALIPGFDDEEETEEQREATQDKKLARMLNGMTDTILRGTGIYGAVVSTVKNTILKFLEQDKKGYTADHTYTIIEAANIAPPIGSKLRKIYSGIQTYKFDKDVIAKHPWDVTMDGKFNLSPTYSIIGNVASATLNVPLDRAIMETQAITEAFDKRNTAFQRMALGLGWRTWDVNAKNEEFDLIKTGAKSVRKEQGKVKAKETRRKNTQKKATFRAQVYDSLSNAEKLKLENLGRGEINQFYIDMGKKYNIKKD
jgi:hypothetical protein